jgi:hypothetical protein
MPIQPSDWPMIDFTHRQGDEPVTVGPIVLIVLEEGVIVLGDQKPGHGISRQIVSQRRWAPMKPVANVGRRAFEHPWRGGTLDLPRPVKVIEVSERADAISRFPRLTFPPSAQNPGDRVAFICSVQLCIGPTDSECRSRVFSRVGIGNRLGSRRVPADKQRLRQSSPALYDETPRIASRSTSSHSSSKDDRMRHIACPGWHRLARIAAVHRPSPRSSAVDGFSATRSCGRKLRSDVRGRSHGSLCPLIPRSPRPPRQLSGAKLPLRQQRQAAGASGEAGRPAGAVGRRRARWPSWLRRARATPSPWHLLVISKSALNPKQRPPVAKPCLSSEVNT